MSGRSGRWTVQRYAGGAWEVVRDECTFFQAVGTYHSTSGIVRLLRNGRVIDVLDHPDLFSRV